MVAVRRGGIPEEREQVLAHVRLIVACIGISIVTSPERAENRNVRRISQQPILKRKLGSNQQLDWTFITPKPVCNPAQICGLESVQYTHCSFLAAARAAAQQANRCCNEKRANS